MIKINLLGDETVIDTSGTWLAIGYVLSVVITFGAVALLYFAATTSINELTQEKVTLEKRLANLQQTTKQVRELEAKRKELAEKTAVITNLKRSKMGPVHVVDDLNLALPDKSWLSEVRENSGLMRIGGLALDNQTIAEFMKALERSNYFKSIELGETRQVDRAGIKIKEFIIQAQVAYAGKTALTAAGDGTSSSEKK